MTNKTIAIILSLLVAVMPFLGFPEAWKTFFYVIAGLSLAALVEIISIKYCPKCDSFVDAVKEEFDIYEDPEKKDSETTESEEVEDDEENEIILIEKNDDVLENEEIEEGEDTSGYENLGRVRK
jgi:hypothetical protein